MFEHLALEGKCAVLLWLIDRVLFSSWLPMGHVYVSICCLSLAAFAVLQAISARC